MKYDPFIKEVFVEAYPEAALRPCFQGQDGLVRAAALLCQRDSPLGREKDWGVKAAKAKELLGVDINVPEWPEIVYEFFRMAHDIQYEVWWSQVASLHIMTANLRAAGMKDNDRLRLIKEVEAVASSIMEYEAGLFQDAGLMAIVKEQALEASFRGFAEQYSLTSP